VPNGSRTATCESGAPVLSFYGTRAVFTSNASDLLPNDGNGAVDVFAVARPGQVQFDTATPSVHENDLLPAVIVTRVGGADGTVSVAFNATAGTATANVDFTPVSIRVVFGPGETSKLVRIPIARDAIVEPPETVILKLSDPAGGATLGDPATAVLTILDATPSRFFDVTPQVQVSQRPRRSTEAGGRARIKVTLTNAGETLHGPIALVLDGLLRKVKLLRAAGVTGQLPPLGSPLVQAAVDELAPGQSLVFDLVFTNPNRKHIHFKPRVIVGPGLP
jgi:hypothetical protein